MLANLPPVNIVPVTVQEATENPPFAFTDYRENLIAVSDPDADPNPIQVNFNVQNGKVTLLNQGLVSSGLTYTLNDGIDDTDFTVQGSIADLNVALSWVIFKPDLNFTGPGASIKITTDDLGNTGTGSAQSDTDTIDITVSAINYGFTSIPSWTTTPSDLDTSFDSDGLLGFGETGALD